jgi:hypothetical protein
MQKKGRISKVFGGSGNGIIAPKNKNEDENEDGHPVRDGRFWLYPGIDPLFRGTRPQYHRRVEA